MLCYLSVTHKMESLKVVGWHFTSDLTLELLKISLKEDAMFQSYGVFVYCNCHLFQV